VTDGDDWGRDRGEAKSHIPPPIVASTSESKPSGKGIHRAASPSISEVSSNTALARPSYRQTLSTKSGQQSGPQDVVQYVRVTLLYSCTFY
jgi:hypothetical protein